MGDIDISGVNSEDFTLELDGLGTISISGTCKNANLVLDGMGDLKARDFECERVRLIMDGMGDATVYASEYIFVNLDGFGNADVYGNPKDTKVDQDGMGDVDFH